MYIIQNALKNVVRNKGRNILMGAIILAIIVTTVISLIIYTTSGAIIEDYKTQFGTKVYINPDTTRLTVMGNQRSAQTVPLYEVYAAIADSEHLMSAFLTCQVPSVSDTLIGLGERTDGSAVPVGGDGSGRFPTMNVQGYTDPEQHDDFRDGIRVLASGTFPVNHNECILSTAFADKNNIEVGDVIDIAQGMVAYNPLSLTVVGIYYDFKQSMYGDGTDEGTAAAINVRNDIITNYETAVHYTFGNSNPRTDTAAYYLKSPDLLSAFESEARAAGLSVDYLVTTDIEAYNRVVAPVEGMARITFTFMIVVLILGGLILVLLSSLAIRERKYEVGVLRAMGMKKHKVALGLVCETLIITVVCLIIGLGIGTAAAQPVSDVLLRGQATAQSTDSSVPSMNYAGVQTDTNAKPLTELDVSLNISVLMTIILISLLLVLISSAAGISNITKYEPIKILMERN